MKPRKVVVTIEMITDCKVADIKEIIKQKLGAGVTQVQINVIQPKGR